MKLLKAVTAVRRSCAAVVSKTRFQHDAEHCAKRNLRERNKTRLIQSKNETVWFLSVTIFVTAKSITSKVNQSVTHP